MKHLLIAMMVFLSTSVMAYDQVKCIKYVEGDEKPVMEMIRTDLLKAAKTPSEVKTVKGLDTKTMIAAGYAMYCIDQDIDMMKEVGAE